VNQGRTVFSQLIAFPPDREFPDCVTRSDGHAGLRGFPCQGQRLAMAFAQPTYRESLRDIAAWRHLGEKRFALNNTRCAEVALRDAAGAGTEFFSNCSMANRRRPQETRGSDGSGAREDVIAVVSRARVTYLG